MARTTSRTYGKNNWALFLIVLVGIVLGSFLGYITRDIKALSWLNYGLDFSIGDTADKNLVTLNLVVLVIHFGMRIKITIGSIIGVIASIFIYRKL